MITKQEVIRACLALPFVDEDYPFMEDDWAAMRHRENRKVFAFVLTRQGQIWVNVKADPMWAEVWRSAFSAVVPAYHMNKRHWVSIILDGTMDDEDILRLIRDSYALTAPKRKKREESEDV